MDVSIRAMTEEDLCEVRAIEWMSYSNPWNLDALQSELNGGAAHRAIVLRDEQNALVGYCYFWLIPDFECTIANIAIHPDHRRKGLGKYLLDHIAALCWSHHIDSMVLDVRESNHAARTFYETLGFAQIARRKNYYLKPKEDALVLKRNLRAAWRDQSIAQARSQEPAHD